MKLGMPPNIVGNCSVRNAFICAQLCITHLKWITAVNHFLHSESMQTKLWMHFHYFLTWCSHECMHLQTFFRWSIIHLTITMLNAIRCNKMQQDATRCNKCCCILLPSAENKRTIVLAGGSCCIEQPARFSVVALCCIQQGVCEMPVGVRIKPWS